MLLPHKGHERDTVSFGTTLSPNWNQSSSRNPLQFSHVLLYFQPFTEKPVFECPFANPILLLS